MVIILLGVFGSQLVSAGFVIQFYVSMCGCMFACFVCCCLSLPPMTNLAIVWLQDLHGFHWTHSENVFLSESQRDKKWNPYIFEWIWSTYRLFPQCCLWRRLSDDAQHTKSAFPQQKAASKNSIAEKRLRSWLTPFSVFTFLVWVLWLQLNFLTPN